jgi:Tfp pilus assembly protein PilX
MRSKYSLSAARKQSGMVLFIALIVLVSMTLAAIGMTRSIDTSNLAAGNMAMKQSALNATDRAIEEAVAWLDSQAGAGTLKNDSVGVAYFSAAPAQEPKWTDPAAWASAVCASNCASDAAGNITHYVIHRMCTKNDTDAGDGNPCAGASATGGSSGGGSKDVASTTDQFKQSGAILYRVTAKVDGPRNTQSYTQVMIALGSN